MEYRTLDPATGELIERFPFATDREIETALADVAGAAAPWAATPTGRRAELLAVAAERLEAEASHLALTMSREMGKPLAEGAAEAVKSAWGCRHYAEHGAAYLEPRALESDGSRAFQRFDPLGPVLAIMPWNFPFWQFFRFAAPALMAGNTILLKHAPSTPRCALEIVRILGEAGLPEGVLRSLFLSNEAAGRVIGDARVRGVTLTGSARAGSEVAAQAGRFLRPMVLELGGSDPFIVLDDADLEAAVETAVTSRCLNSGQSCIAAKRFLVQRGVYDVFAERLVARMRTRVWGDPTDPAVQVGPLAREDLRDGLADQVRRSVGAGARALCGGEVPDRPGFFYPPTVLDAVEAGSPAAEEELFGPVASLFRFEDEGEALALANGTRYGLGASVWTADVERGVALAAQVEAGNVFVNGLVKSDPRLPFGGVKDSGFGRELGRDGMLEFVNVKTVWVG